MNKCKYQKSCEYYRTTSFTCNNFLARFKGFSGEVYCGKFREFENQEHDSKLKGALNSIYAHFERKKRSKLIKEEDLLANVIES